jgi:hypothetical protein
MLLTWTLLLVAIVVVGLAAYLIAVEVALLAARRDVARIADALEAVVGHTGPLEEKLVTINGALSALAGGLETAEGHLGRAARAFRL